MKASDDYQALIAEGIRNGQYPEHLYKYRTLESAIQYLEGPSIYASSILGFNDPYEGHFVLDSCNTQIEWEQFLRREAPDMLVVERKAHAKRLSKDPKAAKEIVEPIIQEVLQSSGVFCLSKKWDNIATWAYYSEDHKGICIEYDPLKEKELCEILLPVNYSDDYVTFNYLREQNGPQKAILQKANYWHLEEEYRIIKNMRANQVIPINPEAITSIILGCRFIEGIIEVKNKEEKEKRRQLFEKLVGILRTPKYSKLNILLCEQLPNKYQLVTRKITLNDLIAECNK